MKHSLKFKTLSTFLWILFTILLIATVLWPIYSNDITYNFYFNNILFIVVFIFFFRYIFLIRHTFIENKIFAKLIIMPLGIFMAIYSYMAMNDFVEFYQGNGLYYSFEHLPLDKQFFLGKYIQSQYIFFGVASLVTSFIIPVKMLISVSRVYNKGHE